MSTDPRAQRHHLVSRGYQRNFADGEHRVVIVSPRSGKLVERGRAIRSNFAEPGYNTRVGTDGVPDGVLEEEFAKLEGPIADQLRRIRAGTLSDTNRRAIVSHFALHVVRSKAFRAIHLRILDQVADEEIPRLAADPDMRRRYEAEITSDPAEGEILAYITRAFDELFVGGNRALVESMADNFNKLSTYLAGFQVQLIRAGDLGCGFFLGDVPIVHAETTSHRYGYRDGLAVGDANLIAGPLTPEVAAVFTVQRMPPVTFRTKADLERLNAVFVRAALEEVACHPDDTLQLQRLVRRLDRVRPPFLSAA